MSRNLLSAYFILLIISLGLAACSPSESSTAFFGEDEPVSRPEIPEQYSGLGNTYIDDPIAISAGETLFEANCSSCHGLTGEGDGPASGGMVPPPGNLALRQVNLSDAYLYWRISEGGLMEPFNSIMPGWKGMLDDQSIWQIISYIRTMVVL